MSENGTRYQTDKKYADSALAGAYRAEYRSQLAKAWLKENRIDVWKEIEALAVAKFPLKKRGSEMPKSLSALKG